MKEGTKQILSKGGIDISGCLSRFCENEDLLYDCLGKFIQDNSYFDMKAAQKKGDDEALYNAVHTLKGVSGNLGIADLYKSTCYSVALFKEKKIDEGKAALVQVEKDYDACIKVIREAMAYEGKN